MYSTIIAFERTSFIKFVTLVSYESVTFTSWVACCATYWAKEEIFLYRSTIFIMLKTNITSPCLTGAGYYLSPSFSAPVRRVNRPVVPSWPFFQASCRLIPCSTTESLCPSSFTAVQCRCIATIESPAIQTSSDQASYAPGCHHFYILWEYLLKCNFKRYSLVV